MIRGKKIMKMFRLVKVTHRITQPLFFRTPCGYCVAVNGWSRVVWSGLETFVLFTS